MIKPTVGRIVHIINRPQSHDRYSPEAAMIVHVTDDNTINVAGHDAEGRHFAAIGLHLRQAEDPAPESVGWWAEWMPFQKDAAAGKVYQMAKESTDAGGSTSDTGSG